MLERVWRKGNPLTLLVGMQTSTAAMENNVEISEKSCAFVGTWLYLVNWALQKIWLIGKR